VRPRSKFAVFRQEFMPRGSTSLITECRSGSRKLSVYGTDALGSGCSWAGRSFITSGVLYRNEIVAYVKEVLLTRAR